jgi:hypothetical protein
MTGSEMTPCQVRNFPLVRTEEAHPSRIVTEEQLEAREFVAATDPEDIAAESQKVRQTGPSQYRHRANKAWPIYALSLAGAPLNRARIGPDRSMADFTWCVTAIDRGGSIEEATK